MYKRDIAKAYKKVKIYQQKSDFAYWQTQSYQARLTTLEQLRQEYHHRKYRVQPGFQRVYTIIKR